MTKLISVSILLEGDTESGRPAVQESIYQLRNKLKRKISVAYGKLIMNLSDILFSIIFLPHFMNLSI